MILRKFKYSHKCQWPSSQSWQEPSSKNNENTLTLTRKKVKKKETKNMWDRQAHSITICLDSASHDRSRGLPNFIDTSPFEPSSKSFNELFAHTTMRSLASSNYINNTIHIHSTNPLKPTQLEMLSLILLLHHLMFLVVYCVDETMMRLNCLYR